MEEYYLRFLKGSRFLVTGGAGFIGSNLVERLLELGCAVIVLDNFSTGEEENIKEFMDNENFTLIEGDVRNIEDCRKACSNVDYVLHQAALGSVPRSIEDPISTNASNVCGTLNMMVAARDSKIKRFVYASSSSVYGDAKELPKKEEKIGKPLSPYAISKLAGELYGKNFYELYRLPAIGLRYFNVFGKKQNYNSAYAAVIPRFVEKLIKGERPTIYGDGNQSRDFTYVGNIVEANLAACFAEEEAFGDIFNVGNEGRVSINELYSKICELLHLDIAPVYAPERRGDVRHSNADISKAKRLLKYKPLYTFNEGLCTSIDWYKNHI